MKKSDQKAVGGNQVSAFNAKKSQDELGGQAPLRRNNTIYQPASNKFGAKTPAGPPKTTTSRFQEQQKLKKANDLAAANKATPAPKSPKNDHKAVTEKRL